MREDRTTVKQMNENESFRSRINPKRSLVDR